MKINVNKRGVKIALLLAALVVWAVTAEAGIILRVHPGAIRDKDGANGANPTQGTNLEFFSSTPADPRATTGSLTLNLTEVKDGGTTLYYQFEDMNLNGGSVGARTWKGTPRTAGSFYGKFSYAATPRNIPPTPNNLTDLRATYKADKPNVPTIGTISESLQRSGSNMNLQLGIPVNYNETGSDGYKRETTGFSVVITYPSGSAETRSGSSVTLQNTPAGKYKFKPVAVNWFGSTDGAVVDYETLGVSAGSSEPFVYTLEPYQADKLIVNTIAVPTGWRGKRASDLAALINGKRGEVIGIYGWNKSGAGYGVAYSAAGEKVSGDDFELVPGIGYQVYLKNRVENLEVK